MQQPAYPSCATSVLRVGRGASGYTIPIRSGDQNNKAENISVSIPPGPGHVRVFYREPGSPACANPADKPAQGIFVTMRVEPYNPLATLVCAPGQTQCGGTSCDSLADDPQNCGACGTTCSTPNGTARCDGGLCGVAACNPGRGSCDGSAGNGCETDTSTSTANCGACNNSCSSQNASATSCSAGICNPTCSSGFGNCDGNGVNGCETLFDTDPNNCGACAMKCSNNHITAPSCSGAQCVGGCDGGYADCNADKRVDGCEVNTNQSFSNCGGCGASCSTNNVTPACTSGQCTGTCSAGFADCDTNKRTNGCEANLMTSPSHCGACGNACTFPNGTGTCSGGTCVLVGCFGSFRNCDGNQTNGCETNTKDNASNCGACGNACAAGKACISGVCQP